MTPASRQRGAIAGALIIVLVLSIFAFVLARLLAKDEPELEQDGRTRVNMQKISDALVAFASLNKYLPCPALGSDATGATAAPATANANCTDDAGVVPWVTLALRKEDSLDGWGHKISYRVFSGALGFTRAGGVSMIDCNTDATATGTSVPTCDSSAAHTTAPGDFLHNKGIAVTGVANPLAFVLISHGSSGVGAYGAESNVRVLPPNGGDEWLNTQSTSPYKSDARSDPSVLATNVNHFDDVVTYLAFLDLVAATKLSARAWGVPGPLASQSFSAASMAPYLNNPGYFTNPGDYRSTQQSINFGTVTVTASSGRNVSYGQANEGIGAAGSNTASAANLNSGSSEFLDFSVAVPARYFGIQLITFSTPERVQFTFTLAGSPVGSPFVKTACHPAFANFYLDPGGTFDQVEVRPVDTSGGSNSTFLVGSVAFCAPSQPTCTPPGSSPADDCP